MLPKWVRPVLAIATTITTFQATAQCDPRLYGQWSISHSSVQLDKDLQLEDVPNYFTFAADGQVEINLFLFEEKVPYRCEGEYLILEKQVHSKLKIIRLNSRELIWHEQGADRIHYLSH